MRRWAALRRRWRRSAPLLAGAILVVAGGVAINQVDGPVWIRIGAFAVAVVLLGRLMVSLDLIDDALTPTDEDSLARAAVLPSIRRRVGLLRAAAVW
jgi:hypothetical protein